MNVFVLNQGTVLGPMPSEQVLNGVSQGTFPPNVTISVDQVRWMSVPEFSAWVGQQGNGISVPPPATPASIPPQQPYAQPVQPMGAPQFNPPPQPAYGQQPGAYPPPQPTYGQQPMAYPPPASNQQKLIMPAGKSSQTALILSILLSPGIGHIYIGQVIKGIVTLVALVFLALIFWPLWIIMYIVECIEVYQLAKKLEAGFPITEWEYYFGAKPAGNNPPAPPMQPMPSMPPQGNGMPYGQPQPPQANSAPVPPNFPPPPPQR